MNHGWLFAVALLLPFLCVQEVHAQLGKKKAGDPRVQKILDEAKLKYEVTSDGDFKLIFKVDDDRSQVVFINSATESYGDFEIREIWSISMVAGAEGFEPGLLRKMLTDNQRKKLGAWNLITTNEKEYAAFTAKISADLAAKEMLDVVQAVLETADEREKLELGSDDF